MLSAIGFFAACLPPVGTLLPLKASVRVPTGIVVQVFEPYRNDAEFRGCDAHTCRVMMHARTRQAGRWQARSFEDRGFGPVVELPRALFDRSIRLPDCAAPLPKRPSPPPAKRPSRKPRRRLVKKPAPPPAPPVPAPISRAPTWADRAPFAPSPQVLTQRAMPPEQGPPSWVSAPQTTPTAPAPIEVGRFVAPGGRVHGEILPDGRVEFAPAPTVTLETSASAPPPLNPWDPPQFAGVGGRGEGLNALDGADIYAREKRLFLEQTAPQRAAMRQALRRQALVDYRALYAACDAAMVKMSGEARRTRLFMLWDEIDDDSEADAAASARSARAYIERLVRSRLPRRAGGYSIDELVRLNLCRAPPLFDPYADPELPDRVAAACKTR